VRLLLLVEANREQDEAQASTGANGIQKAKAAKKVARSQRRVLMVVVALRPHVHAQDKSSSNADRRVGAAARADVCFGFWCDLLL